MIKTKLSIHTDTPVDDIPNPLSFDFWLHESRLENYEHSIAGNVEPIYPVVLEIFRLMSKQATARIEIATQSKFGQWRVAARDVNLQDGSIVLAITNTAPDNKSLMPPNFGKL